MSILVINNIKYNAEPYSCPLEVSSLIPNSATRYKSLDSQLSLLYGVVSIHNLSDYDDEYYFYNKHFPDTFVDYFQISFSESKDGYRSESKVSKMFTEVHYVRDCVIYFDGLKLTEIKEN